MRDAPSKHGDFRSKVAVQFTKHAPETAAKLLKDLDCRGVLCGARRDLRHFALVPRTFLVSLLY